MAMKKYSIFFYILIVALFLFTITKMDFSVIEYLSILNLSVVTILIFLQITTIVIISHQWYCLARVFNKNIRFAKIVELNVIGTFTESITPAVKSGGEGVKLFLLKRDFSLQYDEAFSVIIVQKTISSLIFMLYFAVSISKTRYQLNIQLHHCIYLVFAIIVSYFFAKVLAPKKIKEKILYFFGKVAKDIKQFKNRKSLLAYLILNNLIVWLGYPIKLLVITRAFDVNLNFIQLAAIIFITYGVSMLPTTPGSIGTYEGTMTLLLHSIGVPTQLALAISIVTRFFTFWLVIILSGLYLAIIKFFKKPYVKL